MLRTVGDGYECLGDRQECRSCTRSWDRANTQTRVKRRYGLLNRPGWECSRVCKALRVEKWSGNPFLRGSRSATCTVRLLRGFADRSRWSPPFLPVLKLTRCDVEFVAHQTAMSVRPRRRSSVSEVRALCVSADR